MTSPGNPPIIPQRGYTASTIYQLQDVDPDALGRGANADMHGELEGVRGNLFNGLLGGFTSVPAALVPIINGIFNGWFGGGGVGDPLQVQYTIEAIADAVINGYTVETKVTSGTWTKPATITELVVIGIGGGRSGANGSTAVGGPGGDGGLGGGYIAQTLDPAELPVTVPYTIGAAGQATTFGSFFSVNGGLGGIASDFGFTPTTSTPGKGGDGGKGSPGSNVSSTSGTDGEASALGLAGSGGSSGGGTGNGQPGAAGGNVSAATRTKCGGGGGGGGGRGAEAAVAASNAGAGGIGATGIIWIFWR